MLQSDVGTLPVGMNSMYVYGMAYYEPYVISIIPDAANCLPYTQLTSYLNMSDTYSINEGDPGVDRAMTMYILHQKLTDLPDGKPIIYTKDEVNYYARMCFGIENFVPAGAEIVDGGYTMPGMGGFGWSHKLVSQEEKDGIITIRVRFYSDYSQWIESDLVEYTFDAKGEDVITGHRFIASSVIEKGATESNQTRLCNSLA